MCLCINDAASYTRSVTKLATRLEAILKVIMTPIVSYTGDLLGLILMSAAGPCRRVHIELHSCHRRLIIHKFPEGA